MRRQYYFPLSSPIGTIVLMGGQEGLSRIRITPFSKDIVRKQMEKRFNLHRKTSPFKGVIEWFEGYLEGKPEGYKGRFQFPFGTPFQQRVWRTLLEIPFGQVRSYQWVAKRIGSSQGVRAVGQANGKNPLPILIPCHRVIYQNGFLGGYSGGLGIKRKLLQLEGWTVEKRGFVYKEK